MMTREIGEHRWTEGQRRVVMGAVEDLLEGDESPRARELVALAQGTLGVTAARGEPADFAVLRGDPLAEVALVAVMVAACLRSEGLTLASVARVRAYADVLGEGHGWVRVLRHAARGRHHRVTLALARHAPDGRRVLREAWQRRGLLVIVEIVRTMMGATRAEPERGWWFKRLGLLPEGTVGRAFWSDMTRRGIALPGEAGGLPEAAVHHDLLHTLADYGTDPAGECEIGGFYAGFLYPGWPSWILAGLCTFELGLRVGPSFTVPTRGAFDARRVLAAALRGHAARFDPLGDWDYATLMPMRLGEARARLGI